MKLSINEKVILITGGTGSFGKALAKKLLANYSPKKVIIFSRDEWKQSQMRLENPLFDHHKIRYFLGDIRDKSRLLRAFKGVDVVIHAAALKQVPTAEYNPSEYIKTNINGAMNVIDSAIDCEVEKVIALSTDKAVNPINLYGATKLCSDKLFVSGNVYVGSSNYPKFSVVRYGNVIGSRGSIIPHWLDMLNKGATSLPITDPKMTRFWITLEQATNFVINSLSYMQGGEIFVPKIPSMKIIDLAKAIAPNTRQVILGIRAGEKLHESLISSEDSRNTLEFEDRYVIFSDVFNKKNESIGKPVADNFIFSSDKNTDWLSISQLQKLLTASSTTY